MKINCLQKLQYLYTEKNENALLPFLNQSQIKQQDKIQCINKFSQLILNKDPHTALDLINYALQLDKFNSESLLILSFIEHRLTHYDKSLTTINMMLNKTEPSIFEVINSANLLVRMDKLSQVESLLDQYFNEAITNFTLLEPLMYISLKLAKWDYVAQLIKTLENEYSKNNFKLINESPRTHLLWCENEYYNNKVVLSWSQRNFPHNQQKKSFNILPIQNRQIKIGYISSDIKEHPTAYLINGLIKNHNKSLFKLYIFDSSVNDNSAIRKEVLSHFDEIHTILNMADEAVSTLIQKLNIDILIDLNGPTKDTRMGILSYSCAPVQISYLGYPGSVGGRFIDYIVGDYYTIQDEMLNSYNEYVIKLEDTYQVNDYLYKQPLAKVSKKSYGFKNKQIILGVFNSINKVRKDVWIVWMDILKSVDNAIIWILDPGVVAFKNILIETKKAGIDPKRIIIAPKLSQKEHLTRLQICDLMLDTWPYSGHTSTSDAIFAKVPVVTKKGRNFTCRVSAGLLIAAGLEELICDTLKDYKRKAIKLLKKKKLYKSIKMKLENEIIKSDIFDARSKTIQLEDAFQTILERKINNLPKVNINMKKPKKRPLFSIVTVCKNRLEHLKQTLPLMCQQNNCEVILVDYDCPQKCGKWAKKNYPQVKVVKSDDKGEFCVAKGRNIGGFHAKGDYIFFVDADIFLHKDFSSWIKNNCNENHFCQSTGYEHTSLAGTVIVPKKAFMNINGYDEAFVGWAGEDDDLYSRLEFKLMQRTLFPSNFISTIEHGDEIRQFGENNELMATKLQAHKVNSMYRRIKYDLMILSKQEHLNIKMRNNLMNNVKKEIKKLFETKQTARIEIKTPPQGIYKLHRKLIYEMD